MLKINSHLLTDVGLVRKANEDCFGEVDTSTTTKNGHVFIVCDGMGGHVGGAVASRMAADCIIDFFNKEFYDNIYLAIEKSISFANNQVFLRSQSDASLKGMGTTCTVLVHRNNELFIGHVGDSRIYIQTDGKLSRLTKDHSYVQTLVDKGEITDAEMELHPRKNELTQALGVSDSVNVDVCNSPILPKVGDKILMCSDGLCGFVSDNTISKALKYDSILKTNNALISLANNAGGGDNITVGLIEILESPHHKTVFVNKNNDSNSFTSTQEVKIDTPKNRISFNRMKPLIIGLPIFILFCCLYCFSGGETPFIKEVVNSKVPTSTSTSTSNEIAIEDSNDEMTFVWKVDSAYKFGGASAQFQKEFSKQKKSKGKLSNELNTHIQSNAMFTFNDSTLNYQNAKARYLDEDISLEGGVFTITYPNAIDNVDAINSPVKKKIATPKKTIVDEECKDLQKKLKNEGYYNGKIDGDCGDRTDKAEKYFEEDKELDKLIVHKEANGWLKRKPKFANISSVNFKGVLISDEIKVVLIEKLLMDNFTFKLSSKTEVVLFRSGINIDLLNNEIKEINKKIENNDKILEVSFNLKEELLSYPLIVEGVPIGYYNYKVQETPKWVGFEGFLIDDTMIFTDRKKWTKGSLIFVNDENGEKIALKTDIYETLDGFKLHVKDGKINKIK